MISAASVSLRKGRYSRMNMTASVTGTTSVSFLVDLCKYSN